MFNSISFPSPDLDFDDQPMTLVIRFRPVMFGGQTRIRWTVQDLPNFEPTNFEGTVHQFARYLWDVEALATYDQLVNRWRQQDLAEWLYGED